MAKSNSLTKMTDKSLSEIDKVLKNEYVCWGLRILLVLYAAMVAPNLNEDISNLFDNVFVRLVVAGIIVFLSFHDPTLAILLSICFVVSIQTLNKHKVSEIAQLPNENFQGGYEDMIKEYGEKLSGGLKKASNIYQELPEESQDALKSSITKGFKSGLNNIGTPETESVHENFQNPQQEAEMESQNEMRINKSVSNAILKPTAGVCGGKPFTSKAQFFDAQNNFVSRNQRNQVQSFCPQTGPQGTGSLPVGYSGYGYSDSADF